jgi:hypothetical protein
MCARTHEHCAGSLCTGKSNNNNGGFSGFLKVGGEGNFLKFSQRRDPFPARVHAIDEFVPKEEIDELYMRDP